MNDYYPSLSLPPHHLGIIVQAEDKAAVKDLRHFAEAFPELVGADPLFSQGGDLCFQLPDGDGDKVVAVFLDQVEQGGGYLFPGCFGAVYGSKGELDYGFKSFAYFFDIAFLVGLQQVIGHGRDRGRVKV